MFARKYVGMLGYKKLAELFNVPYITVYRAVKGYTYGYLNKLVPPQL